MQSVFPKHRLGFRFNELEVASLESEALYLEVVERALRPVRRQG